MRTLLLTPLLLATALSAQALPARPAVTVGGAMANPDDELVKVTGARRLPDGRIVVAIGNPIEVRVYDAQAKLLTRFGRKGGGPGEFRAAVAIPYADNDSIVTFTPTYDRYEIFTTSGKLIHEFEQKSVAAPPPLLHRVLFHSPDGNVNGCARGVMMAMPLTTPANLVELFPDRSGHLWAHALQARDWRVYSLAGPFLGTVTLPAGARVLDFGTDYVLAHLRDADDFEEVVEFRVSVPKGALAPPCAARRDSFPLAPADPERAATLKQAMLEAMSANEVVFSDVAHYPSTADSLKLKLPSGVVFGVIAASRMGYADVALDTKSTLTCLMRVGDMGFPWPEGKVYCGD